MAGKLVSFCLDDLSGSILAGVGLTANQLSLPAESLHASEKQNSGFLLYEGNWSHRIFQPGLQQVRQRILASETPSGLRATLGNIFGLSHQEIESLLDEIYREGADAIATAELVSSSDEMLVPAAQSHTSYLYEPSHHRIYLLSPYHHLPQALQTSRAIPIGVLFPIVVRKRPCDPCANQDKDQDNPNILRTPIFLFILRIIPK